LGEAENRAKAYQLQKHLLSLAGLIISASFLLMARLSGLSALLNNLASGVSNNFYIRFFVYLVYFGFIYYLIMFPINFCGSFTVEHKFGLSNQNVAGWFKEYIKNSLVSAAIFLALIEIFYAVARNFPGSWWMISSACWAAFSILFANIFPVLIIPIFYNYNKLGDNELRNKILKVADRFNIKVMDLFEIDLSKNTKKSNAALVGWGNTKRVILADNLLNEFTGDEIEIVVAHEMAHYKLKHIWKLLISDTAAMAVSFYLLGRIGPMMARRFGAGDIFDPSLFPIVLLWFTVCGILTLPLQNAISRKLETAADTAALKITESKGAFISLMEKLAQKNLSDKTPSRVVEFLLYDHPSISRRIGLAERSPS